MKHFEELPHRSASSDPPDIPPANDDLLIDCGPPIKAEMYQASKQVKNGKSAGPDSIPLKTDKVTSLELLHPLFKSMW